MQTHSSGGRMKVGNIVKVDYISSMGNHWNWVGMVTGVYGHKIELLINGEFEIWRTSDLDIAKAEVIT